MKATVMQESIRAIREQKGLKVAELAELAKVSVTVIYRMENEDYPVTRIYAQRVINALTTITGQTYRLEDFPGVQVREDRRGRPVTKQK